MPIGTEVAEFLHKAAGPGDGEPVNFFGFAETEMDMGGALDFVAIVRV